MQISDESQVCFPSELRGEITRVWNHLSTRVKHCTFSHYSTESIVFSSPLRENKIYNFRLVKKTADSCVAFVQTSFSCVWIGMHSNGPCLLFRPLPWLLRLVPPFFLATVISLIQSPEIRNFHSPKRPWNTTILVKVLEKGNCSINLFEIAYR